ncbi:MAG: type II toxin-antitoxin system VapC family toxin [bacterium]
MRFWDASAVVPLIAEEPLSRTSQALLGEDSGMVVWWGTLVECWSALARRHREGKLDVAGEEAARAHLRTLQASWSEIHPNEDVRAHTGRLLRMHPLRAQDALQLAAALVWTGSPPAGEIVVLDRRLQEAARLEGLKPLPGDAT